jgi:hypothetical protein
MKLFLVHCGFYDATVCQGLYEAHANFFVAADSAETARAAAKTLPEFQAKRMHVDGLQEIVAVGGLTVKLEPSPEFENQTVVLNHKHRELAPKVV